MINRSWVQYFFNTKAASRLKFAGKFQRHSTLVRTPEAKFFAKLSFKKAEKSVAYTNYSTK